MKPEFGWIITFICLSSMEQVFKIRIKNTDAAGVEIVPTPDGVEIIVNRVSRAEPSREEDKVETLRAFCSKKKEKYEGDREMLRELKAFWDWYSPKMPDWKGKADCQKLWSRWLDTRKDG